MFLATFDAVFFVPHSLRALLDSAAQVIRILNATQGTNVLSTQWYILFYAVSVAISLGVFEMKSFLTCVPASGQCLHDDCRRALIGLVPLDWHTAWWNVTFTRATSNVSPLRGQHRRRRTKLFGGHGQDPWRSLQARYESRSALGLLLWLTSLFLAAENSLTLLRPPSPSDMPMPPDEQTAALLEAIANPDMAQFHDWTSVLSQFITPDDTFGDMDQLMELFPK